MDNTYYIGIDIGGTRHNIGLSGQDGILVEHIEKDTDRQGGPKAMISSIVEIINQLIARNKIDKSRVKRVGIGFGGPVNSYKGIVIRSVHVDGWNEYPLAQEIANLVNIPVIIDNDVNAAVLGEWYFGAGKGYLIIIGGGIVSRPDDSFLNPLTSVVKRTAMKEASVHVNIVKAENGYLAGVIGGVALAIHAK